MDRFSDDRDNFEPSNSGFDPDEAIARYLSQKSEQGSEDDPEAEPEELDEESEPEAESEHHAPFNHSGPILYRPVFGRKGL